MQRFVSIRLAFQKMVAQSGAGLDNRPVPCILGDENRPCPQPRQACCSACATGPTPGSWQRFADLYSPYLYGWLRRHAVAHQDAEDIAQDTLQVVAEELSRFRHNGRRGAFRHWLRAILANRLRAFRRYRKVRSGIRADTDLLHQLAGRLEDPKSNLAAAWDQEHDHYVARRLLDAVQVEFQTNPWRAFHRVALEAADPEAVAAELGMSVDAVYAAKSRVIRRLRQEAGHFLD
jgi:RNA polymerase sigma-70 factor (ECF subfamily)